MTFTDDELDALAPEGTRSIDIEDFVDIDEIDPMHFDTAVLGGARRRRRVEALRAAGPGHGGSPAGSASGGS